MGIKIAASSTMTVNQGGLSLSVSSYNNAGATAAQAPVLLAVQADKVYTATEFAASVASTNPDMNSAQVARILNAFNEALAAIIDEATDAPTVDFGWAKFIFEIGGSLATASETPTLVGNPCYFSGSVLSKYQAQFRLIDASVDMALVPCDLKRIRDKATSILNSIFGNSDFYADGRGLSWGGTGESVSLWDETMTTKKCDLTLDSAKSYPTSMSLKIPTTANVPVGIYWVKVVCVKSGTAYTMTKKVTVAQAATPAGPTVTSVTQTGIEAGKVGLNDHEGNYPAVVNGTLLSQFNKSRGDKLMFDCYNGDVLFDTADQTDDVTTVTDTGLQCSEGFAGAGESYTIVDWAGKTGHVWAIINGVATPKINVTFVDPR